MWMQSAGFKRYLTAVSVTLFSGLFIAGCGSGTPEGSGQKVNPAPVEVTGKSGGNGSEQALSVKKPASSSNNESPAQTAAGEVEGDEAAEKASRSVVDFPMPDLTLLSDAAFQRNAKMGRLVAKRRCILCHKIEGRGAILQPPLVQVSMRRLKRMLDYDEYLEQLQSGDPDRFTAGQKTFEAIRLEQDVLKSMRLWLKGYLKHPTFDNSQAKMPLQVLIPAEIEQLACYVIQLAVEGYQKGETPLED